jgi:hypothetical protein
MGWLRKKWKQIKNVGKKVVKAVTTGAKSLWGYATGFIGGLFGYNMAPAPGNVSVEQQQGTTVTYKSGDNPIQLVTMNGAAGGSKIGGHMTHMTTSGTNNKFLYVTYVLGIGQFDTITIQDLEYNKPTGGIAIAGVARADFNIAHGPTNPDGTGNDVYTNTTGQTVYVTPPGPNWRTATSSNGYNVNNKAYGKFYINNGASSVAFPPGSYGPTQADDGWTHEDNQAYPGLAFVKMRLEWPSDIDPSTVDVVPFNGLPNFEFFGSKTSRHRLPGIRSNMWHQDNPLTMLYDYLRSKAYGLGLPITAIDINSFEKAFVHSVGNVGAYWHNDANNLLKIHPRTTLRLDPTQPIVANIKSMLYALGATLVWKDNKFYYKPNPNGWGEGMTSGTAFTDFNITTHTINEGDAIGGVGYETPPENEKYKSVTTQCLGQWTTDDRTANIDTNLEFYQGLDANIKSKIDLNAKAETTIGVVGHLNYRLSQTLLLESHYGSVVSMTLGAKHSNIEVFDIINVNYARANLSGARYVVLNVEHSDLETITVRAVRYLFDNDAEGVVLSDIIARMPQAVKDAQGIPQNKALLAIPTGYGLDNNTQIDQFTPNTRQPSKVTSVEVGLSPDFYIKKFDSLGGETYINRVKVTWTIEGDPNNTKYRIAFKKQGEVAYDDLYDTNQTSIFLENLEDLTEYWVQITPMNAGGFGFAWRATFTTLDASPLNITASSAEQLVTDENGGGQAVLIPGASAKFDEWKGSGNPYAASYVAGTYQPYGFGETSVAGSLVTDTFKDHIAATPASGSGAALCWNDYDWDENGGAGSRTDGGTTIVFNPSDLRPGAYADEAAWNAAVGTWGGTKHAANQYGELQWWSYNKTAVLATTSASSPGTTLTGITVDSGASEDYWWEGKVEVAPDAVILPDRSSYAFEGSTSVLDEIVKSESMFVYMYSSDTNDAIAAPVWATPITGVGTTDLLNSYKPGSAPNTLTDWGTAAGDARIYSSFYGGFHVPLVFPKFSTTPPPVTGPTDPVEKKWGTNWPINKGRYITPILCSHQKQNQAIYGIRNYDFKIKQTQFVHTFEAVDTSALAGSSASRTFTWTGPRWGRIKSVSINNNTTSAVSGVIGTVLILGGDNVQSFTLKVVNSTTHANVDATIDITVSGYPEVAHITSYDSLGNIRAIEYKQNFNGTLPT